MKTLGCMYLYKYCQDTFLLKIYASESASQFPAFNLQNLKVPWELPGTGTVYPSALGSPLVKRFPIPVGHLGGFEVSDLVCYHEAGTMRCSEAYTKKKQTRSGVDHVPGAVHTLRWTVPVMTFKGFPGEQHADEQLLYKRLALIK